MKHIYDVIVIGGGPGGYTAALYCCRAGLDTLIIERMSIGGQMTLTGDIENYPGFDEGIDGYTLGTKMQQGAEKFGALTEYGEVSELDLSDKIKRVKIGEKVLSAKTVVIATGANPRMLGLDGEEKYTGRGVHYCAHCDGRFYKDKTVVVVGGGNSAVSDAIYLSRLANKVYLVHRRDTLRASRIYHEQIAISPNIEFIKNSRLTGIAADMRINAVMIENTVTGEHSSIDCDGIFVSIGRVPATELVQGMLSLDENGYIIAGESTKTDIDGVYAVGDVRTKPLRQIVTATSDGATASHFIEEYLAEQGG